MTSQTPVQIAWERVRMPDVHFGPDTCVYRGELADYRADIPLSYAGAIQLEVIAPTAGHSIYAKFLEDSGPGLHHICLETADFDGARGGAVPGDRLHPAPDQGVLRSCEEGAAVAMSVCPKSRGSQ